MMSLTTLLALTLTACTTLAKPTPRQTTIPTSWTWHVENWNAGCAHSGCSYNFNVTIPTIANEIGGVKAYCSGYENGNLFTACQILEGVNNGVAAKLGPRASPDDASGPKKVFVSFKVAAYEYTPAYNFTGSNDTIYNAFVAPLAEFDITPTEVSAVA